MNMQFLPSRKFLTCARREFSTAASLALAFSAIGGFALVSAQENKEPSRLHLDPGNTASTAPKTSAAYRLTPSDLVVVSVFEEPELEAQSRIAEDGSISLPLIGNVKVSGSTVKQAVDTITALYKQDYLVHPVVTVTVLEQTKGKITILGAVGRAGSFEVPAEGGLPLMEAIAMAGGFTRVASQSRITVKRIVDGREQVFKPNGKEQTSGAGRTFLVYPGDIINVGESIF